MYTPNNAILEQLVNGASTQLGLQNGIGVNTSEELVQALVNRRLFVGLEFHHEDEVSGAKVYETILCFNLI